MFLKNTHLLTTCWQIFWDTPLNRSTRSGDYERVLIFKLWGQNPKSSVWMHYLTELWHTAEYRQGCYPCGVENTSELREFKKFAPNGIPVKWQMAFQCVSVRLQIHALKCCKSEQSDGERRAAVPCAGTRHVHLLEFALDWYLRASDCYTHPCSCWCLQSIRARGAEFLACLSSPYPSC